MAVRAANLVFSTVQASTPLTGQLPSVVWLPFSGIHNIHRMWRHWRRAVLYTDKNNIAGLAAGHAAYLAGGANVPFIRCIARVVMTCSRILECIEQQAKLCGHCRSLIHVIKGEYLPHHQQIWPTSSNQLLISPSTIIWWRSLKQESITRSKELVHHLYHIITGIFNLSMLILNAAESFSSDPETTNESIREFYCNMTKNVDGLVNNSERLLDAMTKHKDLIQKVLTGMSVPISFDQILASLNKALGNAHNVNNATKTAQAAVGDFMINLAKNGLFSFLLTIGLSDLIPNVIVTPLKPLWASKDTQNTLNRYPPREWVTRPSMLPQPAAEDDGLETNSPEKVKFKCPNYLPVSKQAQASFKIPPAAIPNTTPPTTIQTPSASAQEKSHEHLANLFNNSQNYLVS